MKPTGARIEMLQAVADGAVTEHFPILPEPNWSQWDRGPGWGPRYRKVSARVEELRREYPCGEPNDGTRRGPWCAQCNPRRLDAISRSLEQLRADFGRPR